MREDIEAMTDPTMNSNSSTSAETNSRGPYIAAAAFFLLLIIVGVLALLPKLRHRDDLRAEAAATSEPPIVLATRLKGVPAGGHVEIPATVQAFDQTPVFARTSGYLKARYVDIGDHVRKGQLLALIYDPQTDQSLIQAKATLAQLKAALAQAQANAQLSTVQNQRWQSLVKEGVVAQQDADTKLAQAGADDATVNAAKANIAAGEANIASLTEQVGFSRVLAPFDGVILTRSVDVGSLISSGSQNSVTQMFTIGGADKVRVFASLPQSNSIGVLAGQVARVTFRELPGKVYSGTLARTSQSIDPGTRTLLLEVDLKNDGHILPGMYATISFDLPKGNSILVMLPQNALVVRIAGPQAVVLDSDDVVHFRSVVLGRDVGSGTEVLDGVKVGDAVVLSPDDSVIDGVKVKPNFQ
jgi:RND family efflux transporter MFP subunit